MTSPSAPPTVSVIIPARGAAPHVAEAIRSALAQGEVTEVVVAAADAPTRAAAEQLEEDRVVVVDNPEGSTPRALNRALAKSTGEIVVRCDAHAVLPPGFVETVIEVMGRTGAVNVGGRQVPRGRTTFERAVALAMVSPLGAGDARYRIGGSEGPVDTVYLGAFRRSALEEVGGFDETLERNQDYELNWRLRRAGGQVWFVPALGVEYRPRGSIRSLWRQYYQYGFWKLMVLRRHSGSLRWRQLASPALVAGLIASVVSLPFHRGVAAALPSVYVTATMGAALVDGVRTGDRAAAWEPLALWTMHIGWGTGFIAALLSGRR
ncbi:MAG: glycosyltransferase family 2 protein [Actinomycetota bacterium]